MVSKVHAGSFRTGRWLLISITSILSTGFSGSAQHQRVRLRGENLSIRQAIDQLDRQGIQIVCDPNILKQFPNFNMDQVNIRLDLLMKHMLADTWLYPLFYPRSTMAIFEDDRFRGARIWPLNGRVIGSNGEPVGGATILVKGTDRGVTADWHGWFHIADTSRWLVLQVSCIGYFPYETPVITDRKYLDITLRRTSLVLDLAIVEPYGVTNRRCNTANIEQLTAGDIRKQPVSDPLAALEGRVPGLVVTQYNGVPGSSLSVRIRGQNSIAQGNDPLYLIDGVPVPSNNQSLGNIPSGSAHGPAGIGPLSCVDPGDIDNIEVLKDAEATAIYGSRGAGGVILITTKKGTSGRPQWSADLSFGGSRPTKTPRLLNTHQYTKIREEAISNDGDTVGSVSAPELVLWDSTQYRNTDFTKMVVGNPSLFRNARVSVSGGDTTTTYLLSGDLHQESIPFPGSPAGQRQSLFASLRYHSRNSRLSLQQSTLYSTTDSRLPVADPSAFMYLAPNVPASFDNNGKLSWQANTLHFLNIPAQRLNTYHGYTQSIFTHWQASYEVLPGLTARASLGYNSLSTTEHSVTPIAAQDPDGNPAPTGSYFSGATRYSGMIGEPQLEYVNHKGRAGWGLLLGATWEDQRTRLGTVSAEGYTDDALLGVPNRAPSMDSGDSSFLYLYEALFARAKFSLADKYFFTFSGRRDGSSRFGSGRQFGNFGSVGGAWLFQKENFFHRLPFISYGKLRGSFGVTGNDQIGDLQYAGSWRVTHTQPDYGGLQGVVPSSPANPDLGWEVIHKLEGGLELGAWHDLLFFSATWYRDWSSNQLLDERLSAPAGFANVLINLPVDVLNTGWEFMLRAQQILPGPLGWSSALSLTIPRNRLVSFPGLANFGNAGALVVGKSLSTIRTYQYAGVDQVTGLYRFRDVNGDGHIDDRDLAPGRNSDLQAYAGWDNEISYKKWQLSIFVEGRQQNGVDPLVTLFSHVAPGSTVDGLLNNMPIEVLRRWQRPGDREPLQRFTASASSAADTALGYYVQSDAALRDASFIRVKTVSLSYRLPAGWSAWRRFGECRLYLQGQNLFTFTHYPLTDPETQNPFALPPLRTLVAGIRINF